MSWIHATEFEDEITRIFAAHNEWRASSLAFDSLLEDEPIRGNRIMYLLCDNHLETTVLGHGA